MNGKHLKLVGLLIIPALLLFAIACGGDTPPDQPGAARAGRAFAGSGGSVSSGAVSSAESGAARRPGSCADRGFGDGSGVLPRHRRAGQVRRGRLSRPPSLRHPRKAANP